MTRTRATARVIVLALLCLLLLYLYRTHAEWVDRTPTPVCGMDATNAPGVHFSAEAVDGLAVRVRSYQTGGVLVAETVTLVPCWWDDRTGESVPVCPFDFPVQRYSPHPQEYAWTLDVAYYRGGAIGVYEPCADYDNCNNNACGTGQRDTYMAWPPLMVLP